MTDHSPADLRTASYEADPAEVRRVLLLYSGGLDTSVMLKWIQDSYEAEVVCLTVNLGQPGEDYGVIEDKAKRLGALECHVVDAREEFAADYVAPAIKANALYGGGYPLFTALGRPLIAKLAVEYARRTGCDTIAHGCTGKGNDQVRIEATVATLAPELKTIAPVRSWQMGREEEIAYAREHGIPVKGGTEVAPYSIDDNLWGRSSEGRWIEDLDHAPEDDVFQLVTRPEEAPDEAEIVEVEFEAGVPVALDGERLGLVELLERAAEIGCRHGVGIVDHIEDRIVGLKVRDIYEVAGRGDPAHRPPGAGEAGRHDPPEPAQARARPEVGLPRLRRALVGAAAHRPRRLHGCGQRPGDRHDRAQALQGQRRGSSPAPRPTPSTTPTSPPSPSPAASSRRPPRRASSSSGRCSRGWRIESASAGKRRGDDLRQARQGRDPLRAQVRPRAATGARSASAPVWPRPRSRSPPTPPAATSPRADDPLPV